LKAMVMGYRPSTLPLDFVCRELNLDDGIGRMWFESCGCVVEKGNIVTKLSVLHASTLETKRSLI